jgi:hypothetical protein
MRSLCTGYLILIEELNVSETDDLEDSDGDPSKYKRNISEMGYSDIGLD